MTLLALRRVLLLAAVVSSPFIWGYWVFAQDERALGLMAHPPLHRPAASAPLPLPHSDNSSSTVLATPKAFLGVLTDAAVPAISGVLAGSPAAEAGLGMSH